MADEMKWVQLGSILTDEQIEHVATLASNISDDIRFTKEAKTYLRTIEAELAAKGVLPEYLAYLLTAMLPQLRHHKAVRNSLN